MHYGKSHHFKSNITVNVGKNDDIKSTISK